MGALVISYYSALRAIRHVRKVNGCLTWDSVRRAEQRQALASCVPNADVIDLSVLQRWGILDDEEELHVLVSSGAARRYADILHCHVVSASLPANALMRLESGLYCTSPAFTAFLCSKGKTVPEVLPLLMELLGGYTLPPEATFPISWGGVWPDDMQRDSVEQAHYGCDPAVDMPDLRNVARWTKSSFDAPFRQAVGMALPGSASPMESILAAMLGAPMGHGGFGCAGLPKGGMLLNDRVDFDGGAVQMASGMPYAICDVRIPSAKIDIEYNGAGHEEMLARIHDGQRNNGLKGMGYDVLVINRDQMRDISALESIAQYIYRRAGVRFRYRVNGYRLLQGKMLSGLRHGTGLRPV